MADTSNTVSETGEIQGHCARRFAAVREAFAANFTGGREVGASFAATLGGTPVVDLWAGFADAARTRFWERDTVANVFSTTKAITALCAHMLADRGALDLEAPVARYWPEFAQQGKEQIPVRWLLSHTAGLAAITNRVLPVEAWYDWQQMVDAIAAEPPGWTPGSVSGYHAMTFGHLVGEIVRRVTGKSVGVFVRDEISGLLGADFQIGLAEADELRRAEMVPPSKAEAEAAGAAMDPESLLARIVRNPPLTQALANTVAWRRAEIPAANGHGNARSLARILSALACGGSVDGVRILGSAALAGAIEQQTYTRDLVLGMPMRWASGFMLASADLPVSPNQRAFGHGGWGGSLAFADLDAGVSWAYVMNKMAPGTTGDTRAAGLVAALYAAL